ncbi:MAG: hypothetical protein ACYC27_02405 [Armatimonadota bacterium]
MRRRIFALTPNMPILKKVGVPLLDVKVPDADRILDSGVSIEPEHQYMWVYDTNKPVNMKLIGKSEYSVLTCWDWENHPVAQTTFEGPFNASLRIASEGRGTWVLTLDSFENGECKSRLVRSFTVCPSNIDKQKHWAKNEFWVGQCSFPGWHGFKMDEKHYVYPEGFNVDQSRERDAELVSRMGVGVARIDMAVYRRDQEGRVLDFTSADKSIKTYTSQGMDIVIHLFVPYGDGRGPILPKYADVSPSKAALYPIQESAYRYYVREVAKRYGKYAKFFQIRNEPANDHQYLGTSEEFAEEVRIARDEIKKLYPEIPVTNGGYCLTNDGTKDAIKRTKGLTDFASYHWHGDLPGLKLFYKQIRDIHTDAGYPDPVFANTEMGYYISNVGAERANAVYEIQKMLYCWAHKHSGVLLYSSRELFWPRQYSYETGNVVSDYGFVDHFYCPRYVYGAVSAFLDRYAGFKFEKVLKESDNLHAYLFKNGSRTMVSFFAVNKPAELKIESDAGNISLIDPMGNELIIENGRSINITADQYPKSLLLENASFVEITE